MLTQRFRTPTIVCCRHKQRRPVAQSDSMCTHSAHAGPAVCGIIPCAAKVMRFAESCTAREHLRSSARTACPAIAKPNPTPTPATGGQRHCLCPAGHMWQGRCCNPAATELCGAPGSHFMRGQLRQALLPSTESAATPLCYDDAESVRAHHSAMPSATALRVARFRDSRLLIP